MVKVYSKNNCGQCEETKKYLTMNNIPFVEFNIEEDPEAYQHVIESGFRSMPVVEFDNGKVISGFDRLSLMQNTK